MTKEETINSINDFFKGKDFEFVNSIDSEILDIDKKAKKQVENEKNLNNFINNLNNTNINYEQIKTMSKSILEKINQNVLILNDLKLKLSTINSSIIDLLKLIDTASESTPQSLNKTTQIKSMIDDYLLKSTSDKSDILINNIDINSFFNDNNIKKDNFNQENKDIPSFNSYSKDNFESNKIGDVTIKKDNRTLLISEKKKKIFLPYTVNEVKTYLSQYSNQYTSFDDVIEKEFIFPIDYFISFPVIARFRETYTLIRDREAKSFFESLKYAFDTMFINNLNPAIIASCKTQQQLEDYLDCLNNNQLDKFNDFDIQYEINPLKGYR